ncbi:MAG: hypothetical protein OEY34_08625 [Cyclobacteriaceae bacterium]|nr:hypothetical protein [Cyclobacteriaceae bacterium]
MKTPLFIFLFLVFNYAFSQNSDILDTVAEESCSCLDQSEWKDLSLGEIEMTLGLCIIEKALPYKTEISEQYDIDFVELDGAAGEKLGELVGMRMMNYCPDLLIQLGEMMTNEYQAEENLSVSGTITKEEKSPFLTLTVVDETQSEQKFIWLTDFPGSGDLLETEKLKGLKVYMEYEVINIIDPKTKIYQPINLILYVELRD